VFFIGANSEIDTIQGYVPAVTIMKMQSGDTLVTVEVEESLITGVIVKIRDGKLEMVYQGFPTDEQRLLIPCLILTRCVPSLESKYDHLEISVGICVAISLDSFTDVEMELLKRSLMF